VFKFPVTLSKLFTVSSLVRFLSTVPTYGKCVRYNRSFGEGLTGGNFVNNFQIVTYMVYPLSLNNRTFCLQGVFVSVTKLRNDWLERRRVVFSRRYEASLCKLLRRFITVIASYRLPVRMFGVFYDDTNTMCKIFYLNSPLSPSEVSSRV
jgi:hypothetical protein